MALKPGTKEFEQFRKKNFNLNIKVPQSAIDKLMKGGSPSANIKKYAGTDNKVMREAMNRFYGKGWDKKAPGSKGGSNGGGNKGGGSTVNPPRNVPPMDGVKSKPSYGANTPSARAVEGSKGYKAPSKAAKAKNAQKSLNKFMRSPNYRPTTSIGSFNPNAKVSPKDFSFNKLSPRQKEELTATLGLIMLPGIGGAALKGAAAAGKAIRLANVGRNAGKADRLIAAGKTAKGIKAANKMIKGAEKVAKNNPAAAKVVDQGKKMVGKLEKSAGKVASKGKTTAKKTSKPAAKPAAKKTASKTTKASAKKTAKGPRGYNDVRKSMAKSRGGKK